MDPIRFEGILVTLPELRVHVLGRLVHFTLSELRLLLIFLEDPYRTISPEELVRRADLTNASALWQLISRVRILLEQRYVFNAPSGPGYSFAERGKLRRRAVTMETPHQRGRTS